MIHHSVPNTAVDNAVLTLTAATVLDLSTEERGEDVSCSESVVLDLPNQKLAVFSESSFSTEILDLSAEESAMLSGVASCVEGFDSSGVDEMAMMVDLVIKFDTACSGNMSGIPGRIDPDTMRIQNVSIQGFNGSQSTIDGVGLNEDNKQEYWVSKMPRYLALLCAQDYSHSVVS